ncbi:hypothetical protein [Aurantiacibacter suaedae]|uniref:hypothetical protein n=1 Tax=Aurantiacibacter suaedae TaxID=2545755 RepID=UPI0010F6A4DA|nr:hypothetical protein [Aurantiacibacter suaedae]
MRSARARRVGLLLVAGAMALQGCNRNDPPASQVEQAVADTVDQIEETPQPAGPYAPRDECAEVAGASPFLEDIRSAVSARNTEAFVALAAEDVKLDFGGGAGRDQLRSMLASETAPLWAKLDELMTLGCASDGDALITVPWYFAQEINTDSYSGMIVTGTGVPVHETAAKQAPVIGAVSWDVVELVDGGSGNSGFAHIRWQRRESPAGKPTVIEGYIDAKRLRSLIDYRLLAASRNGKWRITSLIAGD